MSVEAAGAALAGLLSGLAHGAWIVAAAAALLRLGRSAGAAARHRLLMAALAAVAAAALLGVWAAVRGAAGGGGVGAGAAPGLPPGAGGWAVAIPAGGWSGMALAVLLAVSAVRLGRVGWRMCAALALKGRSVPLAGARAAGGRRYEVRVASGTGGAQAVGYLRPAVLLPDRLLAELGAEELELVIAHEAAHLARRDDWSLLLQRLVEAALWMHPGVWWLGRRLELERELACDHAVGAATGQPRAWARCLVRLAELALAAPRRPLAPGAAPRPSQLRARVEALLAPAPPRGDGRGPRWVGAAAAGLALGGAMLPLVAAPVRVAGEVVAQAVLPAVSALAPALPTRLPARPAAPPRPAPPAPSPLATRAPVDARVLSAPSPDPAVVHPCAGGCRPAAGSIVAAVAAPAPARSAAARGAPEPSAPRTTERAARGLRVTLGVREAPAAPSSGARVIQWNPTRTLYGRAGIGNSGPTWPPSPGAPWRPH